MPSKSVSDLSKWLSNTPIAEATHEATVGQVVKILIAVCGLFESFGKPAVTKDLDAFLAALRRHSGTDISLLTEKAAQRSLRGASASRSPKPVRSEVVALYVRRLEQALGDDRGFLAVYGQLQMDGEVKTNEIIAIAKQFSEATVKSRPTAMKKILSRHQGLMVSRAKSAATAGRIAG